MWWFAGIMRLPTTAGAHTKGKDAHVLYIEETSSPAIVS
jgi:hypothetical protein